MGIGKIARGLGKVGMLVEGIGYVWQASAALIRAVRRRRVDEASEDAVLRDEAPPKS